MFFRPKAIFWLGKDWVFGPKPGGVWPYSLPKFLFLFIFVAFSLGNSWFFIGRDSVAVKCVLTSNLDELLGGWFLLRRVQCCC